MSFSENDGLLARRKQGLTVRSLDGEVLVYDPETTRASCLNEFAGEVLARCDGKRTPAEIARDLPFENVDPRVVVLALADLQKARLIDADGAIDATGAIGGSRRRFLKRFGLGAAVAVPVVTGIALPAAAQLASGQACTVDMSNNDNCGPGLTCCFRAAGGNCAQGGADCICKPNCTSA